MLIQHIEGEGGRRGCSGAGLDNKGISMLIDKKIQRYVQDVAKYIPARRRKAAERELTDMITDLVRDYAGDREPDILDARQVIEELGEPEMMALSYMESAVETDVHSEERAARPSATGIREAFRSLSVAKMNKVLSLVLMVFTVLAVVFICFGMIALGTHMITTMLPVFTGCVLALVSLAGRSVILRHA